MLLVLGLGVELDHRLSEPGFMSAICDCVIESTRSQVIALIRVHAIILLNVQLLEVSRLFPS